MFLSFNGTSTKTRIETYDEVPWSKEIKAVLMEHPPKQGLKPICALPEKEDAAPSFNGTSTKTRIETTRDYTAQGQ